MSTNIPNIYCLNIGFLKVGTLNVAMLWPGFYGKYKVLMLLLNVGIQKSSRCSEPERNQVV